MTMYRRYRQLENLGESVLYHDTREKREKREEERRISGKRLNLNLLL